MFADTNINVNLEVKVAKIINVNIDLRIKATTTGMMVEARRIAEEVARPIACLWGC